MPSHVISFDQTSCPCRQGQARDLPTPQTPSSLWRVDGINARSTLSVDVTGKPWAVTPECWGDTANLNPAKLGHARAGTPAS